MHRLLRAICVPLLLLALSVSTHAAEGPLRVGVLKFGTVNWELDVMATHALTGETQVEILPLASTRATAVALQGGAADIIVTDWIWVARQRAAGRSYTFAPYSKLVGGIMVGGDSAIASLGDLRGLKVGVAGGPIDKSWLLMRAYAKRTLGEDLTDFTRPSYAAPPLLNELALRGELPAVLNYWHFAARLEGGGMRPLISTANVLDELGVEADVPLLGWVFDESLARERGADLERFLAASAAAKQRLLESDDEWERLRPRLSAPDDATAIALRDAWRRGVPSAFDERQARAAEQVLEILIDAGGPELVGNVQSLPDGTFHVRP